MHLALAPIFLIFFFSPTVQVKKDDNADLCFYCLEDWMNILKRHSEQCQGRVNSKSNEVLNKMSEMIAASKAEKDESSKLRRQLMQDGDTRNAAILKAIDEQASQEKWTKVENLLEQLIRDSHAREEAALKKLEEEKSSHEKSLAHITKLEDKLDSLLGRIVEVPKVRTIVREPPPQNVSLENPKYVLRCREWKKMLGNLTLTRLSTGAYYFNTSTTSWFEAKNWCLRHGMELASLDSKKEMRLLSEASPNVQKFWNYWVDASDIGRQPGDYFWSNGKKVDSDWWHSSEPNSFGKDRETCVFLHISPDQNLWDTSCSVRSRSFVCKVSAEYLICL